MSPCRVASARTNSLTDRTFQFRSPSCEWLCMSLRYLELWFRKMERTLASNNKKICDARNSSPSALFTDAANAFKRKHDFGHLRLLPIPPSGASPSRLHSLRTCAPIPSLPLGKYVRNVLIECYQMPEHYLGMRYNVESARKRKEETINENYRLSFVMNWICSWRICQL